MKNIGSIVCITLFCVSCKSSPDYPFRDTSLPIEQRVEDLVSRLTLEEKVSQMVNNTPAIDRLGIPAYDWQNECLHGVGKLDDYRVTVYPQPIGMAATWDKQGIYQVASSIADEGRAVYYDALKREKQGSYVGLTYWAPNINIFRDPRWGRGHETFGEDPYLTGTLGKMYVEGLQGTDSLRLKASACAKHYAVHSGPESLRHKFTTEVGAYDLWDTYLSAFRDVVVDAHVSGIMCAYNAYGGRPCCGNDLLMMDILRNRWGFKGYVTSDCGAIDDFYKYHHTHPDTISAAIDAVLHGTDLDCIRDVAFKTLVQAVKEERIEEEYVNRAVSRLFTIRFRLGLFDGKEKEESRRYPLSLLESEAHQALALKMAHESIVLLKNENHTLPLKKTLGKLAVVGPNADADLELLGNYHGYPSRLVTVLDAIKAKVSPQTEVYYEKMVNHLGIDDFVPMDWASLCMMDGKPGFSAEYFNSVDFSGAVCKRHEPYVDLRYRGKTQIVGDLNSSAFSVKYSTVFAPRKSGEYTLCLETDKGCYLTIDGDTCWDTRGQKAVRGQRYTGTFEAGKKYKLGIGAVMKGRHGDLSFQIGHVVAPSYAEQASRVKDADAILFIGGLSPALEGEENGVNCVGFDDGDRTTIDLPEAQSQLLQELYKTGKPVVFVMMTGSAIAINWEDAHLPAIVNMWYGGQAGGQAIADVLFGDYNPSGRLPVTFYKNDEDLPPFTDYAMENRTYRYFKGKPLYPFGYGLSYTSFSYQHLLVEKEIETSFDSLEVKVDVTNVGSLPGEEVVQLYLSHKDKEPYLPRHALKGFERVFLRPGETKRVTLTLYPRDFATYNDFSECTVRPGDVILSVGGGQPGTDVPAVSRQIRLKGVKRVLPL